MPPIKTITHPDCAGWETWPNAYGYSLDTLDSQEIRCPICHNELRATELLSLTERLHEDCWTGEITTTIHELWTMICPTCKTIYLHEEPQGRFQERIIYEQGKRIDRLESQIAELRDLVTRLLQTPQRRQEPPKPDSNTDDFTKKYRYLLG